MLQGVHFQQEPEQNNGFMVLVLPGGGTIFVIHMAAPCIMVMRACPPSAAVNNVSWLCHPTHSLLSHTQTHTACGESVQGSAYTGLREHLNSPLKIHLQQPMIYIRQKFKNKNDREQKSLI